MNPEALLSRIRIVLCRPSHPGNIGAAARAMKTMGLSQLHLVTPKQFPDPEADTRATGAVDLLQQAILHDNLASALSGCVFAVAMSARQRDLGPVVVPPRQGVRRLLEAAGTGQVALVFGNETSGLNNDEVLACQVAVKIPTNPDFSSLNLGAAVQVMCYECRMSAFGEQPPLVNSVATPLTSPPATHDELERLYAHIQDTMIETGFFNPDQPGRLMPKLRRLFGRANLERDEVNILRGMLASMTSRTGHGR